MSVILLAPMTSFSPSQIALQKAALFSASSLPLLDERVLAFLQVLSGRLLKDAECRKHSELVALGFWLRQGNLQQYIAPLQQEANGNFLRKAVGLVVHYTPANVDTMFIYSWVCSLLLGNRNLIRVASNLTPLQVALFAQLNALLAEPEFALIAETNLFCQYPREAEIGEWISQQADARVIWGGDDSVNAIRALPSKPRCRDISFADRHSACLINGDVLQAEEVPKLAELLWRDIQPYAQQACSSPRQVFWLGSAAQQAALFAAVGELSQAGESPIYQRNEQLVLAQQAKASGWISDYQQFGHLSVLSAKGQTEPLLAWHNGQQVLLCCQLDSLDALAGHVSPKLQTLSVWGIEKAAVVKLLRQPSITGIDRVVPVGQALDFSPQWDGYNLFEQLSRLVVI